MIHGVSRRTLSRLRQFYGGMRCVVTGSTEGVVLRALSSEGDAAFESLLPVSESFGSAVDVDASEVEWQGMDPLLLPTSLLIHSQRHFMLAQAALSYGCNRIGVLLWKKRPELLDEESVSVFRFLRQALNAARHAAAPELVLAVLQQEVLPIVSTKAVEEAEKASLIQEFASILQDYHYLQEADELLRIVASRLKFLGFEERAQLETKLLRRSALSETLLGRNHLGVLHMLDEADAVAAGNSANLRAGVANARAWIALAGGRAVQALEELEPVVSHMITETGGFRRWMVAPWNALETALTVKTAHNAVAGKGRKAAIDDYFYDVASLLQLNSVQLRPIAETLACSIEGRPDQEVVAAYREAVSSGVDEVSRDALKVAIRKILQEMRITSG